MKAAARDIQATTDPAVEFLEFFYPIHYKLGMALEDALRGGQLTRKQVAILWLIRSEGEQGRRMRRKDIERLITTWLEVSSSAITKALRSMARPPLSLVQVLEDPRSGREKQVLLTAKGQRFLATMVKQGIQFMRGITEHLSAEEVQSGIHFLRKGTIALEHQRAVRAANNGKARLLSVLALCLVAHSFIEVWSHPSFVSLSAIIQ